MKKISEIVVGKDTESHIALLWCQMNAKVITPQRFIREVEKTLGKEFLLKKWDWYIKEGKQHQAFKQRAELEALAKEFIIPAKPTLKERINKEMVKHD